MFNVKRWDWLVPVLILAIILPGCPRLAAPYEAKVDDGGGLEIPRYDHKIYPGEEDPSEKAGVPYVPNFRYAVSAGGQILDAPSERLLNGNYMMLDGTDLDDGVVYYLLAGAVLRRNGEEIEDVRITEFYRKTWQRNGPGWPYLTISEPDIYDGAVKYKKDQPDKPVVDCDHNGDGVLSGFFGALRRIGSVFINLWIVKNTLELVGCYAFNHSVGLAGWGILPAWCVNGPLKKAGDEKTGAALGYQGALEFPIDPGVVKYQYGVTAEIRYKNKPVQAFHRTGIIAMDTDGDRIPDDWEIDHGTNPDDPNDPGNEPVTIPTPNLVGMLKSEAEDVINDLDFGLELHPVIPVPSDAPINTVLSQSPDNGVLIGRNSDIAVTISDGSGYGMMPIPCEFNGLSGPAWVTILHNAGFNNLRAHYIYCVGSPDCEDPAGWTQAGCDEVYAIGWNCGDMAASDFELDYWVKKCIDPDDYYNHSQEAVVAELQSLGFDVEVGAQSHSTVPAGNVFSVTVSDCDVLICVSTGPGNPNPLTAMITAPANNSVCRVGQEITFTGTATGGVPPYAYQWQFPDVSYAQTASTMKIFSVPSQGSWPVYFTVEDSAGHSVMRTIFITINP